MRRAFLIFLIPFLLGGCASKEWSLEAWEGAIPFEGTIKSWQVRERESKEAVMPRWPLLSVEEMARVVNVDINQKLRYQPDGLQWGLADFWPTSTQVESLFYEDCNGFAIGKYGRLRTMGIPIDSLVLVIVKHPTQGTFHMVLAVYDKKNPLVLDNLTDIIYRGSEVGWIPVVGFNEQEVWRIDVR